MFKSINEKHDLIRKESTYFRLLTNKKYLMIKIRWKSAKREKYINHQITGNNKKKIKVQSIE